MATESARQRELRNETALNVAGLLKGQTGSTRSYRLILDRFEPDEEAIARDIVGDLRLTRLRDAVMVHLKATGIAQMTCARCLREYDQSFAVDFDEEYRQTVDVRTGIDLDNALLDDDQASLIDENHELDLREPLRQEILVALPMRPHCGPDCVGPDVLEAGERDAESGEVVDERLARLASLLGDEQADERRER